MKKKLSLALCSLMILGATAAALPTASAVTVTPQAKISSTAKKPAAKKTTKKSSSSKKTTKKDTKKDTKKK